MPDTIERSSHRLRSSDGTMVAVDRCRQGQRDTALVICHGFFQSKATPTFQRLASALAHSYDVLSLDFRGHGGSSGAFTFSAREGAELQAVLAWAQPHYPRLVVMGFSLGAAVAINTLSGAPPGVDAGAPPGVCGLIAVSAPAVVEEIEFKFWTREGLHTGLTGLEPGAGCRPGNPFLKKRRPIDAIGQLRHLPVLFIHGTKDVIVGAAHSRRLFDAAQEPKCLRLVADGGHAEMLFREDPTGFIRLITDWLEDTLPSEATRLRV
jgi:pimeloyl-ACP methyl ester carboxylesterase